MTNTRFISIGLDNSSSVGDWVEALELVAEGVEKLDPSYLKFV